MAVTSVQEALANEARRNELKQKVAQLMGKMDATASVVQQLTSINNDSGSMLRGYQNELMALDIGAGPGITSDFGRKSSVTQMVEVERFAAKDAVIDFVQANPECTQDQVNDVWNAAALASHPEFQSVIQSAESMGQLYRANLKKAGLIADETWESHRQWILNNPKSYIETL